MSSPFDQSRYQVRFEWGVDGFARLASVDIVVVVDVLPGADATLRPGNAGTDVVWGAVADAAAATGAIVIAATLRTASAAASAALAEQIRRGARTSIAVIATGEPVGEGADSSIRFAVEDLLGAGAVIDALGLRGIDHTSPEAAAAGEAFRNLRGALRHLIGASGSGQALADRGRAAEVHAAAELDATDDVPVRRVTE